jgi:L-amino acid N-acyltransferase YncA
MQPMFEEDWPAVGEIYLQGIATGNAIARVKLPYGKSATERIAGSPPWGARSEAKLPGGAFTPAVYAGIAEVSLYVTAWACGQGVAHAWLRRLVGESERSGVWTLPRESFPKTSPAWRCTRNLDFGSKPWPPRAVLLRERRSANVGF